MSYIIPVGKLRTLEVAPLCNNAYCDIWNQRLKQNLLPLQTKHFFVPSSSRLELDISRWSLQERKKSQNFEGGECISVQGVSDFSQNTWTIFLNNLWGVIQKGGWKRRADTTTNSVFFLWEIVEDDLQLFEDQFQFFNFNFNFNFLNSIWFV